MDNKLSLSSSANEASAMRVGEYLLEKKIGEGGMGEVWLGAHPIIGKKVAIKLLSANLTHKVSALERFRREAQAVNEVRHKHIVDIFAYGTTPDGRPYLVMEFLQGQNLADYLHKHGPLPFREIVHIFGQLCRALQAAHDKNIIHRDLKPENIFLLLDEEDGLPFVKVLDFGIAKLADAGGPDITRTGSAFGTPAYMSPEQCESAKNVDHRTDIYALGIILFEMITNKTPFYSPGDGVATVFLRHQLDAVPLLASCVQNRPIPERVEALVQHLLAKDRERRPARCADIARAFQEAVGALHTELEIQPLLLEVPRGPLVRPPEIPPTSQTNPTNNAPTAQLGADTVQSIAPTVVSQPSDETPKRRPLWLGIVALLALVPGALWLGGVFSRTPPEPVLAPLVSAQAQEPSTKQVAASEPSQPAPSTAPDTAPRSITLTLRSTPKGATVTLDGKPLGETPLETQLLAEGRDAVLVFSKKQYEDETRSISLQANTTIDTKLTAKPLNKEPGRPKNSAETSGEKPQTPPKNAQNGDPGKVPSDPNGTLQPAAFSKKKPR